MGTYPDKTRIYLSGERFFTMIGNRGIRFLEDFNLIRQFFSEIIILVNRSYIRNCKMDAEEVSISCNHHIFEAAYRANNPTPHTLEEGIDRWITLITVGYDAFFDEMETVINRLYLNENVLKIPQLDVTVKDVDTTPDGDIMLLVSYDYLPF